MDQMEHSNHKLINLEQIREELSNVSHPLKQVLKIQGSDQILFEIDKQGDRITEIFLKYIEDLVKGLKRSVIAVANEITDFKEFHDTLHSQVKIWENQQVITRCLPKLNNHYISGFLNQVTRVRQEPSMLLEELDQKIQSICHIEQRPPPKDKKKTNQNIKNNGPIKKFKTTTKIELDLIKQLQQETEATDLEVDLLGQMINRQELRMPNEIFKTLNLFKNLQCLKLTLSSTNLSDLGALSRSLTQMNQLTSLQLSLGNTKVFKIQELGKSLGTLKNLQKLGLSLWSTNVGDVDEIGKGIGQIKELSELEICLGNTFVADVQELGKGIGENKNLVEFSLNLEFTKVIDIIELGWAITTLRYVKDFELDLVDTLVDLRMRKNFFNMPHFLNEWKQLNKEINRRQK